MGLEPESQSSRAEIKYEPDPEDSQTPTVEASHLLAKVFLDCTWGHRCDCEQEKYLGLDIYDLLGVE